MGRRHPPHHSLRPAKHLLPPASQVYGQTPHKTLPNPSCINERLHSDIYAIHHRLLRPTFRFIEIKRKHAASAYDLIDHPQATIPISVFWLMPQYCLHGIAEAFMSIGHLEFFYDQAPESMRSTATALFWLSISAGSYTSTLLVTLVHKFTAGENGSNWLPDNNLNKGKLEYFYWLITLLQLVNLIYYLLCAKFYTLSQFRFIKQLMRGKTKMKLS
ncbi:UNVERIFIED_CONTAM: protein NRT1/ PTR FAMILY 3.1 [Sesamum calycinum]|uniref:Protein NRT1/ PTR FAMILY 3.1 n=1 Tax=Sesamum calycinum TaxID=2727403 RepID=A0AAW2QY65_9LAMI